MNESPSREEMMTNEEVMAESHTADVRYCWLVEEHTTGIGIFPEDIPFHLVVTARTAKLAYNLADRVYAKYRGSEFIFPASELTECIKGYLWQAADGTDIFYEVRKLYKVPHWIAAGPVVDRMPPVVME